MPRIEWSDLAYVDLARLRAFLAPMSKETANRAIRAIQRCAQPLAKHAEIGRLIEELPPEFRSWVIEFGHSACIARYEIVGRQVVNVRVRHGRELGY